MAKVAIQGSSISHGGSVVSASSGITDDGNAVAKVGDSVTCNEHGGQSITGGGATKLTDNGTPVALVGSTCSCGAVITSGGTKIDAV